MAFSQKDIGEKKLYPYFSNWLIFPYPPHVKSQQCLTLRFKFGFGGSEQWRNTTSAVCDNEKWKMKESKNVYFQQEFHRFLKKKHLPKYISEKHQST